jgi:hypothetical protein
MRYGRTRRRWVALVKLASLAALFAQLAYGPKW